MKSLGFFSNHLDGIILTSIIVILTVGIIATFLIQIPSTLTSALIATNLIFIIFYFIQWRNTTRPILSIELRGAEDDIFYPSEKTKPSVKEICDGGAFINVSNISNNIATSITLEFSFNFQEIHFSESHILSYLNPNETARIELPFGVFFKTYPDQFTMEQPKIGILPKKTLEIEMDINITYGSFPQYSMRDSYHIQWKGLDGSKEDFGGISSWNERGDWWIYKRKKV